MDLYLIGFREEGLSVFRLEARLARDAGVWRERGNVGQ